MPKVAFGTEQISFELEPGDTLTEREPSDRDIYWSTERFRQTLGACRFESFLERGKPLVVVNDAFRPTPTGQVLALIAEWYPQFTADFIVACGNHPAPSQEEISSIFTGYALPSGSRLFFHDSRDEDSMAPVAESDGLPLKLNRHIFEYHSLIVIGSVEPHYFAGFTGGRKSLIPGLCDIETTRRNHALAVSEEARPLRLGGNPVEENLEKLMSLVKFPDLFSIQIVAGRLQQILGCFCGDLAGSFREAVDLSEQVYSFKPEKQYDLVIAEMMPPLDRNLYQLQKGIENCAAAVKDEGTLVAVSKCYEGIGNDEFYQLARTLRNEEMVESHAELENPPLGIHKLSRIVRLSERIQVKALTGIKHEILEQVFIEPAVSLEAEMHKLKQEERKHIDILLVRDAGLVVAKSD